MRDEVSDAIDVYRVASVEAVDSILKWREIKEDHHAAFMWNGINYLQKMAADVDFIMGFRTVKEWIGFSTIRNPFLIPLPLDHGKHLFAEDVTSDTARGVTTVTNMGHSVLTEGATIGGLSQAKIRKYYLPKEIQEKNRPGSKSRSRLQPTYVDANTKVPSGFEVDADDITEGYSVQNLEDVSIEGNMLRVRQAELVILKEEEKFGKLGRAPDGRIAPSLQAQTEWTALELSRDNHRPITEASVTDNFFALHADKSDIGIAERPIQPWIPKKEDLERSSLVERYDVTIRPEHRGKDKLGGALVSLPSRSTQSRTHNPLPPSVAASIEFDRERRRIQLIAELRGLVDKKELTETEAVLRKKEYDSEVEIRKYGKKNANKKPKDGVRRYSSEASIASSSINVDETYKVDNMKGELADGDESNKSASDAHSLTRSQTVPITNSEPAVESILEQNGDEIPQPESELESELLTQTQS